MTWLIWSCQHYPLVSNRFFFYLCILFKKLKAYLQWYCTYTCREIHLVEAHKWHSWPFGNCVYLPDIFSPLCTIGQRGVNRGQSALCVSTDLDTLLVSTSSAAPRRCTMWQWRCQPHIPSTIWGALSFSCLLYKRLCVDVKRPSVG